MVAKIRDMNKKMRIVVITNDNDYVQLYKYPNLDVYNLQNKSLRDRVDDVDNYLLYKILVGDKSDNIKSIGKKIGDKTAKKMIADSALMQKVLAPDEVRASFELNRKLIDFSYIPQHYRVELFEDLKRIIT
jgi:5'-3' exonuclease